MLEKEKIAVEPLAKPQTGGGKTLVYLSVSFGRKPPHRTATQSIKVTNRLLTSKTK